MRVYYVQDRNAVALRLCGGDKASQEKDVEHAWKLAAEWRSEMSKSHDDPN